jgi:membrane associated rhomboid family serine protease
MGLYDRDYMQNNAPHKEMTAKKMLLILIIINIAAYVFLNQKSAQNLALNISYGKFQISWFWQLFTAGFMHYNFTHILFNMWGLYLFGSMVAPHLNGKKMLLLYLTGVLCGNLFFLLCSFTPGLNARLMGASGAVCAVMAAAATLEPDRKLMMIFMPFTPIKTSTMVILYTVMEIIFELTGHDPHVSHLAHLGGFFGGYILMRIFFGRRLPWDPLRSLFDKIRGKSRRNHGSNTASTPPPPHKQKHPDSRVTQRELDELLDKLSLHGINSLSEYELERLRLARKQMRGEE